MTLSTVSAYDRSRVSAVGTRAVVLGAGMAGLTAARVLADCFNAVTVLERDPLSVGDDDPSPDGDDDPLPGDSTDRRGVPQDAHVHVLLEAGRATLESLFPGFTDDVRSAGGVVIDATGEFRYYDGGAFLADGPNHLPMVCGSRPLLERIVRERVATTAGVTIRPECHFRTYLTDDATSAVDGVEFVTADGSTDELTADLVVDATGRVSRTPRWLTREGYTAPSVETVGIDLQYSTVLLDRPATDHRGFLVAPEPSRPRGGTVVPIEQDRWMLTLFGLHGYHPPTTVDGLREFASALPTPEVARLLETRSVLSETVSRFPFPASQWRRYDRLESFPDGLLAIGDAIASFNPIYGQGMSVAALEALQLHHALATDGRTNLPARFFDRVAEIVAVIWRMTVSVDFEFLRTSGSKPLGTALFNRYLSRLIRTAHTDGRLTDAFARVLRLERHPVSLFRPRILARVLAPRWFTSDRTEHP